MCHDSTPRQAPQQLKYVAYAFMMEGFFWMALMIAALSNGVFIPNPLIFAALIGWGLLRCKKMAFRWAWAFVWCDTVLCASVIGVCLISIYDRRFDTSLVGVIMFATVFYAFKVWQFSVLHSELARRAFGLL